MKLHLQKVRNHSTEQREHDCDGRIRLGFEWRAEDPGRLHPDSGKQQNPAEENEYSAGVRKHRDTGDQKDEAKSVAHTCDQLVSAALLCCRSCLLFGLFFDHLIELGSRVFVLWFPTVRTEIVRLLDRTPTVCTLRHASWWRNEGSPHQPLHLVFLGELLSTTDYEKVELCVTEIMLLIDQGLESEVELLLK